MKKAFIILFILCGFTLYSFSQKEVYFSMTPKDSIKVESLKGFSVGSGVDLLSLVQDLSPNYKHYDAPLSIGYFNEKRIAPSWTLVSSIALSNDITYEANFFQISEKGEQYIDHQSNYRLSLALNIAPRLYLGYKRRYQAGKASLNSGWYISFPVDANATLINTMRSSLTNYGGLGAGVVFGYRRAISKHWFLDGGISLIGISTSLYSFDSKLRISSPIISYPRGISLSAAYTFK